MKTRIILIIAALCALAFPFVAQDLIPVSKPTTTAAQQLADSIVSTLNDELKRRIAVHRQCFDVIWKDTRATPAQILAALGTNAKLVFLTSAENKAHLTHLATLVGKTLDDFLPAEYQTTPQAVTLHDDGTVTLNP